MQCPLNTRVPPSQLPRTQIGARGALDLADFEIDPGHQPLHSLPSIRTSYGLQPVAGSCNGDSHCAAPCHTLAAGLDYGGSHADSRRDGDS